MTTIRQPQTTFSILSAAQAVVNTGQKILFVGQMLSGTATAGVLTEEVANGGAEDALFGEASMLAYLIRSCKKRNKKVQIDAIPLADAGGGVDATGTFVISGTATEAGTLTVIAGSEKNHIYSIAVASADTATVIGDAIEAAITADTACLVSAANVTGTVTCTAKNAGTFGNTIPLEIRGSVGGVTTSVTVMTGGATDPTLTGVLDVIGEKRYQGIVWGYPDATSEVTDLLEARFNADGQVLDGQAFTAKNDSYANLGTYGSALNLRTLTVFADKVESETNYKGGSIVEVPLVKAAVFAGYRGLRLDVGGFSISDIVTATYGPLDAFGGPALASKPYFNTPFADLLPIKTGRGFDATEIEGLLEDGLTVLGNNPAGNAVISGEVVTTYKNDSAGNPDITFKYQNYVDTASQAREYLYNNNRARFSQSRLTEGDLIKGRDMANEQLIRTYQNRLYQTLSGPDYVLFEDGETAKEFFNDNLTIAIDKANGLVTMVMEPVIVTQFRTLTASLRVAFSTQS